MSRERLAVRTYRVLTRLYPSRFRTEYRDDMVSLFRDQCRDEPEWLVVSRAVVDLAITIPTQHLEARMHRTSSPIVPLTYLAVAVAGIILAVVGGSNIATGIVGLAIALGAGTIGVVAWRRTTPVQDQALTGHWWKFLAAGPGLIALVIVAAGLGVDAWSLGVAAVLTALALIAIGIVLGLSHLVTHRTPRSVA